MSRSAPSTSSQPGTTAAGGTTDSLLLHENFSISSINSEKYDRVSRITGSNPDLKFHLDINHDIYPMSPGENIEMLLATTLNLDGSSDLEKAKGGWRDIDEGGTLADSYDYVCYGKIYRFEEMGVDSMYGFSSFRSLLPTVF
ncbi:hypothetical protein ABW19_dt0209968 [Dactylella cylindrospora]|nr:hypothetical protein ABW19_dt0209968 [Dactylella cylindrospora]